MAIEDHPTPAEVESLLRDGRSDSCTRRPSTRSDLDPLHHRVSSVQPSVESSTVSLASTVLMRCVCWNHSHSHVKSDPPSLRRVSGFEHAFYFSSAVRSGSLPHHWKLVSWSITFNISIACPFQSTKNKLTATMLLNSNTRGTAARDSQVGTWTSKPRTRFHA